MPEYVVIANHPVTLPDGRMAGIYEHVTTDDDVEGLVEDGLLAPAVEAKAKRQTKEGSA